MRKVILGMGTLMVIGMLASSVAWAGSPHIVGTPTATRSDDTLTVTLKEAGLGDEEQINAQLTATAECINPGDHHPQAANKADFTTNTAIPVQNGKADVTISVTASLQPPCDPPMTIVFTNVVYCDLTNPEVGCVQIPGTF